MIKFSSDAVESLNVGSVQNLVFHLSNKYLLNEWLTSTSPPNPISWRRRGACGESMLYTECGSQPSIRGCCYPLVGWLWTAAEWPVFIWKMKVAKWSLKWLCSMKPHPLRDKRQPLLTQPHPGTVLITTLLLSSQGMLKTALWATRIISTLGKERPREASEETSPVPQSGRGAELLR